ncbi:hypothetical protein GCM10027185_51810 [Spirosoma pulveris]
MYPDNIYSDIDFIITNEQFDKFWLFMQTIDKQNIAWIQSISHEATAHYCIITISGEDKNYLLKPDVCSDYYRNGTLFLKADYLLQNRIFNSKGFFQLAPSKEFIYYFLKKVDKGNITIDQFNHLRSQWLQDQHSCENSLKSFFAQDQIEIINKAFAVNDINLIANSIQVFRKKLRSRLKFNLGDHCNKLLNRISRILNPTGLVVAFLGPDGCGKTTVINGVKGDITEVFRKGEQFHFFPKRALNSTIVTDPHGKVSRGYIGSIVKLLYLTFVFIKGYFYLILPLKISSTLVIFDRYYHDMLADPVRYRHGAGNNWVKLIGLFIPKPDMWILLDAPADVIQSRKSEVSPEETSEQLSRYRQLFSTLNNAYVVNANQSPEKVIYDAEQFIIKFLQHRTLERYRNV